MATNLKAQVRSNKADTMRTKADENQKFPSRRLRLINDAR